MTTATTARGSYAKSAERRREILDAAFDVFAANGYANASVREIAERVGLSQAGVLFHFNSKTELLAAVLERRDARSRTAFSQVTVPGIDHLRAFLEIVRVNSQEPGMIELYTVLSAEGTTDDHPARDYFRDRYRWIVEMARESFVAMRDQGILRSGVEPGHAARSMLAVVDGLQLQWLYDRDGVDLVAEVRAHLQSLVNVPL